jgi:hypothetical protein
MSTYGDEEEELLMASMEGLDGDLNLTSLHAWFAKYKLFGITLGWFLAVGVFPGLALLFLGLAYRAEIHSYWNLLFLELSSGFVFFSLAPLIVRLGRTYAWQVPLVGVLIACPLLWFAYHCEEFLPSLSPHGCEFVTAALIEYSIALLLMVGLEIVMAPWLNRLAEKQKKVRADFNKYWRVTKRKDSTAGL